MSSGQRIAYSVLDLSPIVAGSDAAAALRNTLDLARHAERWGYTRYWLAEHHSIPGVASAATAVVIGHVAGGTSRIRVGAGGIMLPNHAPLVIAEQFGTLECLHPGRIDLALGRAPGTDPAAAHALRRTLASDPEAFPQDILELMGYFAPQEGDRVRAVPGAGLSVPQNNSMAASGARVDDRRRHPDLSRSPLPPRGCCTCHRASCGRSATQKAACDRRR